MIYKPTPNHIFEKLDRASNNVSDFKMMILTSYVLELIQMLLMLFDIEMDVNCAKVISNIIVIRHCTNTLCVTISFYERIKV